MRTPTWALGPDSNAHPGTVYGFAVDALLCAFDALPAIVRRTAYLRIEVGMGSLRQVHERTAHLREVAS